MTDASGSESSDLSSFADHLAAELREDNRDLEGAESLGEGTSGDAWEADEPAPKRRLYGEQGEGEGRQPPFQQPPAAAPSADTGRCPPHPGFLHGMCIRCCAERGPGEPEGGGGGGSGGSATVGFSWAGAGLELSSAEAGRFKAQEAQRCLAARKLVLVLDLDHTLLNSVRVCDLQPEQAAALRAAAAADGARPGGQQLYDLGHGGLLTKLRPGAREMLAALAPCFELYIYTMGDRPYARHCARLLDPGGRLLGGRIISSADSTVRGEKDLDVVLGSDQLCLILDDSERVWPRHAANLLLCERYHYFPRSAESFGEPGQGLWARDADEDAETACMAAIRAVLLRCHAAFFAAAAAPPATRRVSDVLAEQRRAVLAGCGVVFSGVVPLGCARPSQLRLWRVAESLGAQVADSLGPGTTHLVAERRGTAKEAAALAAGLHCVSPAWLLAAAALWRRPPEASYPVPHAAPAAGAAQLRAPAVTVDTTAVLA